MKKVILFLVTAFVVTSGFAQPTATKTYTNQSGIQNLNTNAGDVIYFEGNNNISSGTLNTGATFVVDKNATLTISGGLNLNDGTFYVLSGASFTSSQNLGTNKVVWYNSGLITCSGNVELGSYTGTSCSALVISGVLKTYNSLIGGGLIKLSGGNASWHAFPLAVAGSSFTIDFLSNGIIDADGATPDQFHPKDADASSIAAQENVTFSTVDMSTTACSTVTPVKFLTFTGIQNGTVTTLTWTTAQEQYNKYFAVLGSVDGNTWDTVSHVQSKWANGTSTQEATYTYTLNNNDPKSSSGMLLGSIVILILMLAVFVGRTKVGKITVMIFSLITLGTSCVKSDIQPSTNTHYIQFKVVQIDLNGQADSYTQVINL